MLNVNTYTTFVFDLDGTLVDSVPDLTLALNHALDALGYSPVTQEDVRSWVGNGSVKLIERALTQLEQNTPEKVQALHQQFLISYEQFLCEQSQLYPDVMDVLTNLHKQGKTLVLLTNKPIQFVPDLLSKFNIAHLFSLVLGGDSLPEKKPHPLPLQHIMETLNVSPQQCLMIGDSRSDIVCAQQAGVDSVALLQGYHQGIDLASLKPTYLLNDMTALGEHLF